MSHQFQGLAIGEKLVQKSISLFQTKGGGGGGNTPFKNEKKLLVVTTLEFHRFCVLYFELDI